MITINIIVVIPKPIVLNISRNEYFSFPYSGEKFGKEIVGSPSVILPEIIETNKQKKTLMQTDIEIVWII